MARPQKEKKKQERMVEEEEEDSCQERWLWEEEKCAEECLNEWCFEM